MWPHTAGGGWRGGRVWAGEMRGERREDPETVEFGGRGYGPAAHRYYCFRRDVERVENLAAPVDAVRERCHAEVREGDGAWGERGDEGREEVFEAEHLEHGHERETLEELFARRQDGRGARCGVARVGCGDGEDDELRKRARSGHPAGEEGFFEDETVKA